MLAACVPKIECASAQCAKQSPTVIDQASTVILPAVDKPADRR